MYRVLIVDDEEHIREMLALFVTEQGFFPLQAGNGEEALSLFREDPTPIVLTDVRMPVMDGLTLIQNIRQEAPETYIAMISGHGDEALAIAALRSGAKDYLKKPINLDELESVLKKFSEALSAQEKVVEDLRALSLLHLDLTLHSDPYKVSGMVAYLLHGMAAFLDKRELADLQLVLSELLLNAIEHGNLDISGEEKRQALIEDRYQALLQERRRQPQYRQRRVTITLTFDQQTGKLSCRIRDEGKGFNWQALPQTLQPEHFTLPHGRGILLSRLLVEELIYNDAGNEVTMIKHLPVKSGDAEREMD